MKSVFVSYVFEDGAYKDKIVRWATEDKLGPLVITSGDRVDVRESGKMGVRNHLSPKLTGAAAVIVLVGQDTHNHDWVNYEAQHALSGRRKVLAVRIPGTLGAPPPVLRGAHLVPFEPGAIRAALGY